MTVARETRATVTYDGGITVMRATYNVGYGFSLYPARDKRE